jgi:general secretion pathway protein H
MPIFLTVRVNRSRRLAAGFTLVELMVVLFLIGMAAATVVIALPRAGGDLGEQAARFAARAAALRDRAVVTGAPAGLWASATGYGFERYTAQGWEPLRDHHIPPADWPRGTLVRVDGQPQGRIAFDRLGLPDRALTIDLTQRGERAQIHIDAAGEIELR